MRLHDYLIQHREHLPAWLTAFTPGDGFPRNEFFASRVVYYPGSGTDAHAVRLFGSTHSAHCFVYADYGIQQADVERELEADWLPGYHQVARIALAQGDIVPYGWTPHVRADAVPPGNRTNAQGLVEPYGFLEVLERDSDRDDTHGAHRLAILFLGADGIATYGALFCQPQGGPPPFAVLLQDGGFDGNYDRFGRGGLLEGIAADCDVFPPCLLVAENTDAWGGFEPVPNVDGEAGGMHGHLRTLYRLSR